VQAEQQKKIEKTQSLEKIIEVKSQTVMEMQRKRQEEARLKNETALARAKANENKMRSLRHKSQLEKFQI